MVLRGDVVLVDFPFTDMPTRKSRPAVVVQADVYTHSIAKTVIAMVTGNLARRSDPAHLLIDPALPEGVSFGLRTASLVSCNNLYTVDQRDIMATRGTLSDVLKQRRNGCLKAALDLP